MCIRLWTSIFLLLLSLYDIVFRKVPNTILISYFTIILAIKISSDFESIPKNLLELFAITVVFLFIFWITKGIGFGDIKLIAVFSFSVGFFKSIYSLLAATLLGIVTFLLGCLFHRKMKEIPFVPFIATGYLACELIGSLKKAL